MGDPNHRPYSWGALSWGLDCIYNLHNMGRTVCDGVPTFMAEGEE